MAKKTDHPSHDSITLYDSVLADCTETFPADTEATNVLESGLECPMERITWQGSSGSF